MGAMLRYKRLTGREVNEEGGLSTSLEYCYCAAASACAAEGVDFALDCQEFCDRLSPEEFQKWAAASAHGGGSSEKKTL